MRSVEESAAPQANAQGTALIESIEGRLVSVPLESPVLTRNYQIANIENVVIRIRDSEGVEGYSYLWCITKPQARVLLEMVRGLSQFVIGKAPRDLASIATAMRTDINFLGYKGVAVFGYSALEMALFDLLCRRLGTSLSRLRGRRHESLPVYWSGLMLSQSPSALAKEAADFARRGFRAFKLRVGGAEIADDEARLRAVLENVPTGTRVMLDAVQCWSAHEAIRAANRFAKYEPVWLEEPVPHNDYKALAKVVANSPVPIAAGENEYFREGFDQLFETGLAYVVVDAERVGGILEWEAVCAIASVNNVTVTPHVYPHLSAQLCASMPQRELWVEYMPWWDRLVTYQLEIRDGRMVVPDVPGTGFDPDFDVIDQLAWSPWISLTTDA